MPPAAPVTTTVRQSARWTIAPPVRRGSDAEGFTAAAGVGGIGIDKDEALAHQPVLEIESDPFETLPLVK